MIRPLFRFGFGLEELGLLAIRRQKLFRFLILAATLISAGLLPTLQFDGDVAVLLKSDRPAYADYQQLTENFPEIADSVTLHVTARDGQLISKTGLARLADFQLELGLHDAVSQVVSPFSLKKYDPHLKRLVSVIPVEFADDKSVHDTVQSERSRLQGFLSNNSDAAMMLIVLSPEIPKTMSRLSNILLDLDAAAEAAGLSILKAGRTVIQAELVEHLIRDQILVTLLGIAAGIVIAAFVFRDWRAVLLCSVTASVALLWILGAMAVLGRPLDAMTTILPILGSILAFADGLHILSHWRRRLYEGGKPQGALIQTIREIGPASGLTSVTTALAFAAMALAGPALANFALFGVATVIIAFLASIIVLPVGCAWMASHMNMPGASGAASGRWLASLVDRSALSHPRTISLGVLFAITAFMAVHVTYEPSFSAMENLPESSQTRRAETALTADFGGSDRIFAMIPVDGSDFGVGPASMEALLAAHDALEAELGVGKVTSVAGLLRDAGTTDLTEQSTDLLRTFLARDGTSHLVVGTISGADSADAQQKLHSRLSSTAALSDAIITGFPIMAAFEATYVIERLKSGLLLAVVLAAGIVGLVCRSVRVFLAVAVANLFVVLLIEVGAWLVGLPGEFSLYIALTIALGIGIDDSVHILNLMRQSDGTVSQTSSIRRAITRAAPALVGSTVILCANILVTAASILPVVTFIGLTVSLTLAFALLSNVTILPSMLAADWKRRAKSNDGQSG